MPNEHEAYVKRCVNDGVALLDKYMPGWEHRIDRAQLDMHSCSRCILGQLYGEYVHGLTALGLLGGLQHGYNLPFNPEVRATISYDDLARMWKEVILNRLGE